ncbi:ABC transporter ATP-binding protein [Bacillus suaedaesalsae]|uniref:Energy-coupling factor ABC transporter ATP-binding protein n=1 Tax=Bacillus suaedaesalsae TaxID=2810349 RepID=A0ABS2DN27_9BACI|nr:ABC transporter ATP-binding protein [Bacillus suaedaesalsae]MBM6619912.1 energy-coupling factor ABC transporter ATP-binding protein [Bacillus suaedaesalsae]
MAHIKINNLSFTYPEQDSPSLIDNTISIEHGEFVVLFGPSGSGKSTLLRSLKKDITPHGVTSGEILIDGVLIQKIDSSDIGYVFQDPENQVVADEVILELVFGLENLGMKTSEMRNKVAEMVHFFGIESLIHRKTHELSGGQKQMVNLASILLMQPKILLLDEPTAQLDPVSAKEFINILVHLNEEFGMTIILAEHRLDEVCSLADKVILMERGRISEQGDPREVLRKLWNTANQSFIPSIPKAALALSMVISEKLLPLNVKEGRVWLNDVSFNQNLVHETIQNAGTPHITAQNIYYQYSKGTHVLKELDLSVNKGELYALLGGNGTGKSTLLRVLAGIIKQNHGKVFLDGKAVSFKGEFDFVKKVGYLPQSLKPFFIHDTVQLEIYETMKQFNITDQQKLNVLLDQLDVRHILDKHPYDLSGGELQKAALVCLLVREPELLILDEPTKGLDAISKERLASILTELTNKNITVLFSTHDVEFAARYATRCGMLFEGQITSEETPREFFKGNFFYTTMIQRLLRHKKDNQIVTLEEAISACSLKTE